MYHIVYVMLLHLHILDWAVAGHILRHILVAVKVVEEEDILGIPAVVVLQLSAKSAERLYNTHGYPFWGGY